MKGGKKFNLTESQLRRIYFEIDNGKTIVGAARSGGLITSAFRNTLKKLEESGAVEVDEQSGKHYIVSVDKLQPDTEKSLKQYGLSAGEAATYKSWFPDKEINLTVKPDEPKTEIEQEAEPEPGVLTFESNRSCELGAGQSKHTGGAIPDEVKAVSLPERKIGNTSGVTVIEVEAQPKFLRDAKTLQRVQKLLDLQTADDSPEIRGMFRMLATKIFEHNLK